MDFAVYRDSDFTHDPVNNVDVYKDGRTWPGIVEYYASQEGFIVLEIGSYERKIAQLDTVSNAVNYIMGNGIDYAFVKLADTPFSSFTIPQSINTLNYYFNYDTGEITREGTVTPVPPATDAEKIREAQSTRWNLIRAALSEYGPLILIEKKTEAQHEAYAIGKAYLLALYAIDPLKAATETIVWPPLPEALQPYTEQG